MVECRLIVDGPKSGMWNMAVDETLLTAGQATNRPTLRVYEWEPATLSLGYFQAAADREQHAPSRICPLVRRHSGGGAILHHHEITYSLVVPIRDRWSPRAEQLVTQVHQSLVDMLSRWGIDGELAAAERPEQPFLCFERRAVGDITCQSFKVAGSAQRRQRGALLQHGSLLLAKSEFAPELPGVFDLSGKSLPTADAKQEVAKALLTGLGWHPAECPLSEDERGQADLLAQTKFGNAVWLNRR